MATLALLATLTIAGYTAFYLIMCAAFPFGPCRHPRTRHDCRRCGGTGRRVRIGRRLYEHLRDEHRHGTRDNHHTH